VAKNATVAALQAAAAAASVIEPEALSPKLQKAPPANVPEAFSL
jgi:hypothetical protein